MSDTREGTQNGLVEGEQGAADSGRQFDIPIANPALDEIRARFEQLIEQYPNREPQAPFPSAGAGELEPLGPGRG